MADLTQTGQPPGIVLEPIFRSGEVSLHGSMLLISRSTSRASFFSVLLVLSTCTISLDVFRVSAHLQIVQRLVNRLDAGWKYRTALKSTESLYLTYQLLCILHPAI